MASEIDIYNLALSNIAAKAFVNSLTEDSNERKYCSANFDTALNTVLEDHDWGFASAFDDLVELKNINSDVPPPLPWQYEYTYPSEAIYAREIVRESSQEKEIPFALGLDDAGTGKVIRTDKYQAKLRYTKAITKTSLLSSRAVEAIGWKLSTMIVISLTGNLELKQNAEQSYLRAIDAARASDFNEGVIREAPTPESITSRT